MTDSLSKVLRSVKTDPFDPGPLLEPRKLIRSVARIDARWPDVVPKVREEDRDRLVAELDRRVRDGDWKGCRLSLVLQVIRAAFDPVRRERADTARVRDFLLREIRASSRKGVLRTAWATYLENYEPGRSHTRGLAAAIRPRIDQLSRRARSLLDAYPVFLDPDRGAARLTELIAGLQDPISVLLKAGLDAPAGEGFMDHVHRQFVQSISRRLSDTTGTVQAQLLSWLVPTDGPKRERLAELAIDAAVKPWHAERPPERIQKQILNGLMAAYGDPRIARNPVWHRVTDDTRRVLRGWLSGATLKVFMDIVSEVEDSHMWEPRRKFWLQLHERGLIQEAWAALTEEGKRVADRIARVTGDATLREAGRQTARSRYKTCILVMRAGNKVIVEGSHNYKVHIIPADHTLAPRLYGAEYDCEEIRRSLAGLNRSTGNIAKSHIGNWQGWVLQRIGR